MQVILIGGAQRSGTTLFQTLVANALHSALLPESHILCDLIQAYKNARAQWAKSSSFYPTPEALRDFFVDCVHTHLRDVATRYGADKPLVLKDPNFAKVMPEIADLLPGAVCFLCVRDPRDIVASFLRIGDRHRQREMSSRYTRRDISFICKKINAAYAPVLTQSPHAIFAVYEKLVRDAPGTLTALAERTGLAFNLSRLDQLEWLNDTSRHQETWISELEGRSPSPDNVGSFAGYLSNADVGKVEDRCSAMMDAFAYQRAYVPEPGPPTQSATSRLARSLKRWLLNPWSTAMRRF